MVVSDNTEMDAKEIDTENKTLRRKQNKDSFMFFSVSSNQLASDAMLLTGIKTTIKKRRNRLKKKTYYR